MPLSFAVVVITLFEVLPFMSTLEPNFFAPVLPVLATKVKPLVVTVVFASTPCLMSFFVPWVRSILTSVPDAVVVMLPFSAPTILNLKPPSLFNFCASVTELFSPPKVTVLLNLLSTAYNWLPFTASLLSEVSLPSATFFTLLLPISTFPPLFTVRFVVVVLVVVTSVNVTSSFVA